jgi:hypothetical protein
MQILALPTRDAFIVDIETDEISTRTGRRIWREILTTTSREEAEKAAEEARKRGENPRICEAII